MTAPVRDAGTSDLDVLSRLHAACFETSWDREALRKLLENARAFALVATVEGGIAAFVLVQVAADECEILTLATLPTHRRRGLARTLVVAAGGRAAHSGAREMFLEVAADNEAALSLYQGLGFTPTGRRGGYYERSQRPAADALILRTPLPLPENKPARVLGNLSDRPN